MDFPYPLYTCELCDNENEKQSDQQILHDSRRKVEEAHEEDPGIIGFSEMKGQGQS